MHDIQCLYKQEESLKFYEARYAKGYMEEWPSEKKQRIYSIIKDLDLPKRGEALDFGCGNGVFTDVLRKALSSWHVFGTDISDRAINNAITRYPDCTFLVAEDAILKQKKFDFVFTHHVLEHVYNVKEILNQIDGFLKPASSMLHIMPCGNPGSYEHKICTLKKNGIDNIHGNRFFFEDEGHVRRLTSEELCELCHSKGFILEREFYANQYYGAINWITTSNTQFILTLTKPSQAIDLRAKARLIFMRGFLLFVFFSRLPSRKLKEIWHKKKRAKDYVKLFTAMPFYPVSTLFELYYGLKTRQEWNRKKHNRNGSEMYLFFKRNGLK